jgi:hypothetical protein
VEVTARHSDNYYYAPLLPVRELAALGYTVAFYPEDDDFDSHVTIFRDQGVPIGIEELHALY